MVFLDSTAATAQRSHRLEHQLTILTRELAIDRAEPPVGHQGRGAEVQDRAGPRPEGDG
jgi:hypothetical protein